MSRQLPLLLAFLAGTAAPAAGQEAEGKDHEVIQVTPPDVPDTGPRPDLEAVAKAIVERTNAFRAEQKRSPVTTNEKLTKTAQEFASFMAKSDKYGHTADHRRPAERAKAHEYDYCVVLENIAYAFDSRGFSADKLTTEFVTGWENSPGHRRNMLDPDATETGVAVARSEKTGHYYAVQMFGRPKSAAIEFRVENRTGEAVTYTLGDREFSLKPRYTRTHTLCRPTKLTFAAIKDAPAKTPNSGDHYVITGDEGNLRLKKQ